MIAAILALLFALLAHHPTPTVPPVATVGHHATPQRHHAPPSPTPAPPAATPEPAGTAAPTAPGDGVELDTGPMCTDPVDCPHG